MPYLKKMILFFILIFSVNSTSYAAVVYKFTAQSSFGAPYGSFEFIRPDFINLGFNRIRLQNLTSCTVLFPVSGTVCNGPALIANSQSDVGANDVVNFAALNITAGSGSSTAYFFNPGILRTLGTYESVILGSGQFATITISQIPEPATWLLLFAGFGAIGINIRKQRKNTHPVLTKSRY